MPRTYKRKTEKKYTLETLKIAVREIKEKKISFRQAEEKYNIPRATLFDQVRKYESGDITDPKRGKKPVFSESQEQELVQYILEACRNYYGVTIPTLRKIAYDFATANRLKHRFDEKTRMAGMDWYYSFMARHPEISLRKPEATSLSRIRAFNKEETDIFFLNLSRMMVTYGFKADNIYNVDETGISTVQRNSRILAPKGLKQVGKCTSGERGTLTTVINACSAAGNYISPFFIFKRKRMNPLLMKQSNSNMVASVSDSGWITEQLFVDWLNHFKSFTRPSVDNPILLVLDNHESHISLPAYEFCKKNCIHVVTLPPHSSHRMQPLDLTFHGPLKTAYNKECEAYMVNNPGAKISTFDVVGLYTKAFNRTTNIEKAVNGFKAAGIFPLDKEKFKATFESFGDTIEQISTTLLSTNDTQAQNQTSDLQPPATPSVSSTNNINKSVDENAQNIDLPSPIPKVSISSSNEPIALVPVPLSHIVNVPTFQSPRKSNKRTMKKKHSIILTSTPEKHKFEKKEQQRLDKQKKKTATKLVKIEKNRKKSEIKKIAKTYLETRKNIHTKSRKGVKNLENFGVDSEEGEYFCIFCNEKYASPPTEDWILCIKCLKWAHENCTSGSSSKGYICDFCHD